MLGLYDLVVTGLGTAAAGLISGMLASQVVGPGVSREMLVLLGLGVVAGWLRFSLAPTGRLTLVPLVFFIALLTSGPDAAFAVAVIPVLISSLAFGHLSVLRGLGEVGEEAVGALIAINVYTEWQTLLGNALGADAHILPYLVSVVSYVAAKYILVGVRASLVEGISVRSFAIGASKSIVLNLLVFAVIALAIQLVLYGKFGYLAVLLAIVALVELYYPWKLLSEQDTVLFANLAMIAQAIDIKDPYTAKHSRNVSNTAVRIARAMRLPEAEVRKIRVGALMHDIGKIGVSGAIIRKPTKLEPHEVAAMRSHPIVSADIMQPIELLTEAAEIVRHHHEHFDGKGYPDGLSGEGIPLGSRVILVADAFDAMTTDRPYRRARSKGEALKVLKENAGKQFDPEVVRLLESVIRLL